jgi:hypothetical protein
MDGYRAAGEETKRQPPGLSAKKTSCAASIGGLRPPETHVAASDLKLHRRRTA